MKGLGGHDGPGRRLPKKRAGKASGKAVSTSAPGLSKLGIKRILVPTDFSTAAARALDFAVGLAAGMGARIILLHVIEPVYITSDPGMTYVPEITAAEEKSHGRKMLEIATQSIPPQLFEKAVVRSGTPYHEIVTAARGLRAGLIVITTHGRTGLSHALLGSTAERVVRHAHCPVLTVRRPA